MRRVRTAGDGRWPRPGRAQRVLAGDEGTLLLVAPAGRGRIALLADSSPLQNRLLGEADNAALALALSGRGPLTFVESVHGYGPARGLAALPARFGWALIGLALAALVFMVARGRRLGPPEPERRDLPPPRRAYVDALAATMARGEQREEAVAPVRAEARRRLARRAGLGPQADADAWQAAALAAGLEEDEARALSRARGGRRDGGGDRASARRARRGPVTRCGATPRGRTMRELHDAVAGEVAKVVVGQRETVATLLAAAALGGHVLLEGPPGVAKTLIANAFARALAVEFRRVQFTPDMLPSDLTGNVTLRGGELSFRRGPVFTNVLLADEVNRTPPKTQAALLEAMQEGQVSVEGRPEPLPDPFLVVATQNPLEYEGTYALPEAQLDRFLVKLNVGYPSAEEELGMLGLARRGVGAGDLDQVRPVASAEALREARAQVDATRVEEDVARYVVDVVRRTRELPSVELGGSPRAAVHLLGAARAAARLAGRDYVTPDDVSRMAAPVLRHRLVLTPEAELERYGPDDAVRTALGDVPVPR